MIRLTLVNEKIEYCEGNLMLLSFFLQKIAKNTYTIIGNLLTF